MQILQIGRLSNDVNQHLERQYSACALWQQTQSGEFLQQSGADFELVVTSAAYGLNAAQIAALPNLRAVCSFGVGYDSIDVQALQQRGIALSNTPDVLTDCVADVAMGMLIDVSRGISAGDRYVRAGLWGSKQRFGMGSRVSGKKLGILGLGRIGLAIAERAQGFKMHIAYHNRHRVSALDYAYADTLQDLAAWADYLLVACPGGAATEHLVDAAVLQALGEHGFLINIARGSVVDEAALVQALAQNHIAGAALDVFEHEPNIPAALLQDERVVLTPHIGSATRETRMDMDALLLQNVAAFINKGQLLTPVS
ncbi:2-hydroxyacid dehydrogenase [Vitreoscilla massiliensis]|uniref:2-hydroxyacid dehydrogenase n=1 Tax=Vitreoscilla massiliensis TaxID=1689272 RepID=A0ABY4DZM3_9NEIS|nr:2-hydroxyacid dehydrogenase [Vitreoscilla massiliensis]UOO88528.1 2-hydroxyacid dehydrogenase [Vitreoscilla massiliensis]